MLDSYFGITALVGIIDHLALVCSALDSLPASPQSQLRITYLIESKIEHNK